MAPFCEVNKNKYHVAPWVMLIMLILLSGCGTWGGGRQPPGDDLAGGGPRATGNNTGEEEGLRDPFERFNRAMYTFNEKADKYVLKPAAKGYRAVTPRFVRRGVSNFFANLNEPVVIFNDLMQGKFRQGVADTTRLLINTTLGLFGLFDVATPLGLEKHNEDFGQTLAVWGVEDGPYLVLPFLGPSTVRDASGIAVDTQPYPPNHIEEQSTRDKMIVVNAISIRAQLLDATDILEQAGGQDPYLFVREFYRQQRRNLIYDGNPPVDKSIEEMLFEDMPPPEDESDPSPAR